MLHNQVAAWFQRRTPAIGARRVASLGIGLATDLGNVRGENQDRIAAARGVDQGGREFALLVATDGIGGMKEGSTCAAMALGTFVASAYERLASETESAVGALREAVKDANATIFNRFRGEGGATLVGVLVRPKEGVWWVSVGDSRIYRLDGRDLTQVSVDDTIAGQLAKHDAVEPEQARLLQFVGLGNDLDPHIDELKGNPDKVVLTTDGAHYFARSPDLLGRLVTHAPDPAVAAKRIADVAKWYGGPDNGTVGVFDLRARGAHEREQPLTANILELWDPFGEMQILRTPKSAPVIRVSSKTTHDDVLKQPGDNAPHHRAQGVSEPEVHSTPAAVASVEPRSSVRETEADSARKAKEVDQKESPPAKQMAPQEKVARRNRRSKKKVAKHAETPQLVVEFSERSEGDDK